MNIPRPLVTLVFFITLAPLTAILSALPAQADPVPAGALVPLDTIVAGINAGDVPKVASAYSVEPTIVDEFPPFHWQGVGAVKRWDQSFLAFAKAGSVTNASLTRGHPTYFHRDGHLAYMVVPATFSFSLKGKPETERGGFVLSLYEMEGLGWKVRSSSWYTVTSTAEPPIGAGLK